jgi:hypothetical protein
MSLKTHLQAWSDLFSIIVKYLLCHGQIVMLPIAKTYNPTKHSFYLRL